MKDTETIVRSGSRTFSVPEMQKKEVYVRKDIKTANPRRFFRNLSNTINEMGYVIQTDTGMSINKDAIGETGYIDGNLSAVKSEETAKGNMLYVAIGALFFLFGFILLFGHAVVKLIGLIVLLVGLYIIYKNIKRQTLKENRIWIKLEGEVYGTEATESKGKKGVRQENVTSELTVHIAGEATNNKDILNGEITELKNKINSLT
ncbi:MAG: hypothetical protein KGH94_04310 [Candidatus Micrarchaeota archaeon]|nr:hypothetical protein [Candidatus Micrarchaeota archaeon]